MFSLFKDDGLRTTPLNLLVGLQGLKLVPHATSSSGNNNNNNNNNNGVVKHVSLHWDDVKTLTHTKHHVVLTSGTGTSIRKRRLCVGTSRMRDAFELLTSHQKMALELKCRPMLMPRIVLAPPELSTANTLPKAARPSCRPPSGSIESRKSFHLPENAESNAVRIFVPYGGSGNSEDIVDGRTDVNPESMASATASSPRKSTLVRMGTKISSDALIREKMRLQDVSFIERSSSADPSGAYVVGNFGGLRKRNRIEF